MAKIPNPSTKARRALAEIAAADIEAITAFVDGLTLPGAALVRGREEDIAAAVAKAFWSAGRQGTDVTWSRPGLQYLSDGVPVEKVFVKAAADCAAQNAEFKMMDAALRLSQGKITPAEFAVEHDRNIKVLLGAESALGRGGFDEMTVADWSSAGDKIAEQFEYSHGFHQEIAGGRYGIPGSVDFHSDAVLDRASQYADYGRVHYENTTTENARDRLGHTHARRLRAGSVDSCEDCIEIADRGWIPIDEYPELGSDRCHSRCWCVTITGSGEDD